MTYNLVSIISGIILLFVISYLLIGLYSFLYLRSIKKHGDLGKNKMLLSVGITSLAWMGSTFLAIVAAASAGIIIFGIIAMLLIFAINFFISGKLFGVTGKHKVIYSLALGIIVNPVWFSLLGVL